MKDKLYIIKPSTEKYRTVNEFLKFFFEKHAKATYTDSNYTKLHCSRGRQRSMNDIYILVKTYYTSISRKRFAEIFKKFIYENNIKGRYCGETRAIVFSNYSYYNHINKDEKYPFLYELDSLAHNSLLRMKQSGFKHEIYNLENLNKLLNDNN